MVRHSFCHHSQWKTSIMDTKGLRYCYVLYIHTIHLADHWNKYLLISGGAGTGPQKNWKTPWLQVHSDWGKIHLFFWWYCKRKLLTSKVHITNKITRLLKANMSNADKWQMACFYPTHGWWKIYIWLGPPLPYIQGVPQFVDKVITPLIFD